MSYEPVDIVGLLDWCAVATLDDGMAAGFRSASSEVREWRNDLVAELDLRAETAHQRAIRSIAIGNGPDLAAIDAYEAYTRAIKLLKGES